MNEQLPHDPNSLADELDRVLPPGQTGQTAPSADPLVEAAVRLSAAPRPTLSPEALARIHATMLAGQSVTPAASRSLTRRFLRQSVPVRVAVAAIAVFVIATGAIFAAKIGVQFLHPAAATLTLPPSATTQPPTATSLPPTATPLPASPTATITDTDTPTPIPPSPTATQMAAEHPLVSPIPVSATLMPTSIPPTLVPTTAAPTMTPTTPIPTVTLTATLESSTAEPTLPVTIVVEGPIQSINGSTIVIFDLTILLNAADLASVHVGDLVRIEGYYAADSQMIIAIRITVIRNTPIPSSGGVETNPSTGQTWTDPGNCSNPPPPWAPANGWRRRCEGGTSPGNSGNNGNGNNGNGSGNGDGMGNGMGG